MSRSGARFSGRVTRGFLTVLALARITGCLLFLGSEAAAFATTACDDVKEQYTRRAKLLNFSERKEAFAEAMELCPDSLLAAETQKMREAGHATLVCKKRVDATWKIVSFGNSDTRSSFCSFS